LPLSRWGRIGRCCAALTSTRAVAARRACRSCWTATARSVTSTRARSCVPAKTIRICRRNTKKCATPWRSATAATASCSGDQTGNAETTGNAVEGESSFRQWFRDVPGVNQARNQSITLVRETNGTKYIFDDTTDAEFSKIGGFFPINGQLYGDYQNGINYHFTFELDTEFTYHQGADQIFRFIGDDDVWVFIDGKLVIDLGGVHSRIDQIVELDRLNWLQDGETYQLKFFFAERHTTQSNFRMETNIDLRSVSLPASTALHD